MNNQLKDENGLALLITVFIITLASVLVIGMAKESNINLRSSRGFIEGIHAEFLLKSALNQGMLAIQDKDRNEEGILDNKVNDDNHTESWTVFNSGEELKPVSTNIEASYKVFINDELAKIDVNSIINSPFWRDKLTRLLEEQLGFTQEVYPEDEKRTLGNEGLNGANQVANIIDFLDADQESYTKAGFVGHGIESRNRKWFPKKYSNKIFTLSELALVPGMTLERLKLLAPFIRASTIPNVRLNIITALKFSPQILVALGADPDAINVEAANVTSGLYSPIDIRDNLFGGLFDQAQVTANSAFQSNTFSITAQIKTPNLNRWLFAEIIVNGRKIEISKIESY